MIRSNFIRYPLLLSPTAWLYLIIRATMSQLNIIVSPDDLEIKAMEKFIVIKSKASAEIILTLGVEQIKPLHDRDQ